MNPDSQFYIDKKILVSSDFEWNKQVVDDLCSKPDKISLIELMDEAIDMFKKFHIELVKRECEKIIVILQFCEGVSRRNEKGKQYPYLLLFDGNRTVSCLGSIGVNVRELKAALDELGIDLSATEAIS